MTPRSHADRLITDMNVKEYFQGSVAAAVSHQKLQASEDAVYYVVNLLTLFMHSDALYERTPDGVMIRPLASFFAEAVDAASVEQRNAALRRLGDVALFIAGVFANSLNRKVVDLDYYISMGGTAYGCLSDCVRGTTQGRSLGALFDELAAKFPGFVDVLGEVADNTHLGGDGDLMRVYETWVRTGSPRAASKLRRHGIQPSEACISRAHH